MIGSENEDHKILYKYRYTHYTHMRYYKVLVHQIMKSLISYSRSPAAEQSKAHLD